jgi:hypothetical protein
VQDITVPDSHRPNRGDEVELCGAWACSMIWNKTISDIIPLCQYHFAMAHAAWGNHLDRQLEKYPPAPDHERLVDWRVGPFGQPVVYYVSMPPHVKIGTTKNFRRRMREMYVQPAAVLAVEPGGRDLETERHRTFATYRIKGTELFKRNAMLDELIARLAGEYGKSEEVAMDIHFPKASARERVTVEVARGRMAARS